MKIESRHQHLPFVADGRERARKGAQEYLAKRQLEIKVRAESAYESKMANSGFFRRLWLQWCLRNAVAQEIRRDVEQVAPRDALY